MDCFDKKGGPTFRNSKKKSNGHTPSPGAVFNLADAASTIIDIISDGVVVINGRGIINLFNPAASQMTGWAATDAVNLDFRSIFKFFDIAERAVPDDDNPIISTMRSGQPLQRSDIFLQTASKKYIRIFIKIISTGQPDPPKKEKVGLFAKLGQPIGANDAKTAPPVGNNVIVIFRDVTAEKREGRAQSDFISTASHEMRTPIAIVEGYLGMLLNPATATVDDRGQVYAQKAYASARHLGHLFRDLLDVTKIDDNRLHSNPVLVDAGAAARQVVDQMQSQAKQKGLELTYESTGEIQPLHIIYVDLDQLQQILDNIIDNAIKYTKQGSIKVTVVENQGKARISVTDTGIGIPAEDTPHLFQRFYRVDNSDTREVGGTGLGLYLIKHLTERLGGQVGVDSDYGRGSTFWIEFNILTRDEAVVKAREIKARQSRLAATQATKKGS
ncbi:ATP-binding protein [Candidatus Saccharibacteria bacterium]|nr:ATP-binding protein [Candidatus Saccharibacteria bacterium]